MFCWNCGKENPDTAVFCDSCGARLVEPQEELPEQEAPVITPHAAAQPTPASDDSAYGRANTESLGEMPAGPRPQAPESEIPFAPSAPQSALRRDGGAVSPADTRPNEQAPLRRQRDGGQGNLRPGGRGSGIQGNLRPGGAQRPVEGYESDRTHTRPAPRAERPTSRAAHPVYQPPQHFEPEPAGKKSKSWIIFLVIGLWVVAGIAVGVVLLTRRDEPKAPADIVSLIYYLETDDGARIVAFENERCHSMDRDGREWQRYIDSGNLHFIETKGNHIEIPDHVGALPVVRIEAGAFLNGSTIRSITIPATVTEIESTAFNGCSKDLVIYGAAGSAAEQYARTAGVEFVPLGAGG